MRSHSGFTLLELLVVVAILAVVASGVVLQFDDVEKDAAFGVAQSEIQAVRDALLAFERDTGWLPGEGPFALDLGDDGQGLVDVNTVPTPSAIHGDAGARAIAFVHPANFGQLLREPLRDDGTPVFPFDVVEGRGWRGPYLTGGGEGFACMATFDPEVDLAFTWSPFFGGHGGDLPIVPTILDPFLNSPRGSLKVTTTVDGERLSRHGAPYLFFREYPTDVGIEPAIVSVGPNGSYLDRNGVPDTDNLILYLNR